jgi:hypothetical protein
MKTVDFIQGLLIFERCAAIHWAYAITIINIYYDKGIRSPYEDTNKAMVAIFSVHVISIVFLLIQNLLPQYVTLNKFLKVINIFVYMNGIFNCQVNYKPFSRADMNMVNNWVVIEIWTFYFQMFSAIFFLLLCSMPCLKYRGLLTLDFMMAL